MFDRAEKVNDLAGVDAVCWWEFQSERVGPETKEIQYVSMSNLHFIHTLFTMFF